MGQQRIGLVAAAAALGKSRKTLQRWRKRPGAPFGAEGDVDVGDLRAWAEREGLLELVQGEHQDEVLAATAASAPAAPAGDPAAAPAVDPKVAELRAKQAEEKHLTATANRKLAEAKAAKVAGELVPLDEVMRFWAQQAAQMKAGLEAAAARIAGATAQLVLGGCATERLAHEVELLAREAHDEVLRHLAAEVSL